ncbi:hypothetical protein GQ457_05G002390 [Hibiscus cannabinus]
MQTSLSQLRNILPIPKLFRQLEQEMETVIKVLQPGTLGIIEHKLSAEEIREANATVRRAVESWRRNAITEQRNGVLKDYIRSVECAIRLNTGIHGYAINTCITEVNFEFLDDMTHAVTAAEDLWLKNMWSYEADLEASVVHDEPKIICT